MIDFTFFRSRTSIGANSVGFLISFAMFAQFFFLTLYLQNVLHYSPLETGLRFLPSTIVIMIVAPLAGRLADRVGSRPLMTLGLVIVAVAMFIESRLTIHSGYGLLLPGFVLMGLGMGLVMSPMSTAAMNAVDRTKAGAASGVLSMSRMVGSTFGVAVMGALVTTIGGSKINSSLPHVPPPPATRDHQRARQRGGDRRPRAGRGSSPRPTTRSSRRSARPAGRLARDAVRRGRRLDADPARGWAPRHRCRRRMRPPSEAEEAGERGRRPRSASSDTSWLHPGSIRPANSADSRKVQNEWQLT